MMAVALFLGFVFGALAVIGVEVVIVLFLIQKLSRKVKEDDAKVAKSGLSGGEELQFPFPDKQGWVWILENVKIPKTSPSFDKGSRGQKRKIEIVEVSPVRKHARIKDLTLILTEPDGSLAKIPLIGCTVEAVSATNLPTRKWAKKYPVKVESKSSVLYHRSQLFYLYFETSSEKESWCKALRLASCEDKEKLKWFHKSRSDFHNYLGSLNVEYPSFLKPSIGFNPEIGDKSIKIDTSSSKVCHFLKKLAKKTSKTGREDKKEKFSTVQESSSVGGSTKLSQTQKKPNHATEEKIVQAFSPRSDTDSVDKIISDDGTLCCNLLISRLFFDAKNNADLKNSIQARIQRTLSTIRTPSYIGDIICTGVNPGNLPPYIHGMRVLPSDLKEVVALEIDIEYYGGAVLDIETRLEVQELENPETMGTNSDHVTSDLLQGVEYYEEQLKLNEQTNQATEHKGDEIRKLEELKSFKGNDLASSSVSKWKSVLNSVANKVSQVPLSMAVRVTTLRGTLRVHIKPPPSDQVWFGFTSMPDIDFSLESSVGDHKITSGHIALFIIGKFKTAIRETMVLPNSESVTIPFMLAEKNDWVPQKVAPFIWTNPEPTTSTTTTTTTTSTTAATTTTTAASATTTVTARTTTTVTARTTTTEPTTIHEAHPPQPSKETHQQEPQEARTSSNRSTDSLDDKTLAANEDLPDEKTPLLDISEQAPEEVDLSLAVHDEKREVIFPSWQHPSPPQAVVLTEESNDMAEGEDARLRRLGTRAKMLGLRKKMGEKLEEKRRNIEEKGRHIVEKMRGPGGS